MIRQGSGRIINVASVAGKYKPLGLTSAAYCTAKSGVLGMTRHLTVLLAPHGIRVNSVLPDDVMTDDVRTWWEGLLEADRKELLRLNPAGRLATPEDIADFVVLLASDGSRFVTGENIGITGGRHMG
jgi:3-oxoacyl-[acyl-carrier protein] reductase